MLRIDLQLEKNQKIRALKKRLIGIVRSFSFEDYKNPITNKSIGEALDNVELELNEDKIYVP